jgi:hypothetical protein
MMVIEQSASLPSLMIDICSFLVTGSSCGSKCIFTKGYLLKIHPESDLDL